MLVCYIIQLYNLKTIYINKDVYYYYYYYVFNYVI